MPAAWPWALLPGPRFRSYPPSPLTHEKRNDTSRTFDFLPRGTVLEGRGGWRERRGNNTETAAQVFEIVAADGKMG